jgi:hypothetical protein
MPQAKKKQATKTAAKKKTCRARKKTCTKTCAKVDNREKMHVYIVTVMGMIAALLLCADVAMVIA